MHGTQPPRTLSDQTIATVKATAPALKQHGLKITKRMYERMFVNEEVKAMFDQAAQESGEQPKRLAAAILAYAENVDKLENLTAAVARMATRHVECVDLDDQVEDECVAQHSRLATLQAKQQRDRHCDGRR